MEEIRTKKGPFKIYKNLKDFTSNGGEASKVMVWRETKNEDAIQRAKSSSHIELSTGEVIPILGLRRVVKRVGVVTPFGIFLFNNSRATLPEWYYDFEMDMRKFTDLVVDTRNFFFAFMVAFPERWVECNGDSIKILNWSYKNNILYKGFFKELRSRMNEQDILDMIGSNLPIAKAKAAIEEILDDPTVEAKVRGDIAMKTVQEFNKIALDVRVELRKNRDPSKELSTDKNPFLLTKDKNGSDEMST